MTTMKPSAIDTEMLCDFSVFYQLLIVLFSLEDPGEVHGSLSVLLGSALCAIAPILFLTTQVPEMDGCSQKTQVLTALYYMASNSQSDWQHSDCLVFSRDFTVRTITMETARFLIFSLSLEIQVERNTKSS